MNIKCQRMIQCMSGNIMRLKIINKQKRVLPDNESTAIIL